MALTFTLIPAKELDAAPESDWGRYILTDEADDWKTSARDLAQSMRQSGDAEQEAAARTLTGVIRWWKTIIADPYSAHMTCYRNKRVVEFNITEDAADEEWL